MTGTSDNTNFDNFFRPASVAIIGASPQRGSARNTIVRVLLKHGFPGRVYPVSHSHAEIEGLKAYASIGENIEPHVRNSSNSMKLLLIKVSTMCVKLGLRQQLLPLREMCRERVDRCLRLITCIE